MSLADQAEGWPYVYQIARMKPHIEQALAWLQDVNQETIGLEAILKAARAEIAEALECLKS